MPTSPARLCRDCMKRATTPDGHCVDHAVVNNASERRRMFELGRRDDEIRALYKSKRWWGPFGTRNTVFRRDMLCKMCGHKACSDCDHHPLTARQVVEQFGVAEFYNPDRCQGLCHSCHSQKTAAETRKQHATQSPNGNPGC